MCIPIIEEVKRSIFARIPAQIIQTTDVAQVYEDVVNFLTDEDHFFSTWSPVLGRRSTTISSDFGIDLSEDDNSYAGDTQLILQTWLDELQDEALKCSIPDDGGSLTYKTVDPSEVNSLPAGYRILHNTLVLVGAEIFLDPNGQQYDPLAVHAVWEIMQLNLRKLSNLIIIIPRSATLPEKISASSSNLEDGLPTRKELSEIIWPAFVEGCPQSLLEPLGELEPLAPMVVDRLCGLTRPAARNTLTTAIIHVGYEDLPNCDATREFFLSRLAKSKEQELRKSGALEILKATPMDQIGGLDKYKAWIAPRKLAFSEEARLQGIPRPKGVLLVGPPGTGKTEVAKATASTLGVPLIRADLGAVYGGVVGASEANMRNMLRTLEAAAPCVVLFDEIEKALGGSSGPSTDSGTSQRVFGTLLSWMQDRDQENMIFIVATSNDVSGLPPEFLRKGRFDELFFVDLPNEEERNAILKIHLKPVEEHFEAGFMDAIVRMTAGFVGAELAQAVVESRINSFASQTTWNTAALAEALRDTKPLSVTMAEKIERVRSWASTRARAASSPGSGKPATRRNEGKGGGTLPFQGIGQ